eukprot:6463733-Prymnesium_polylepis.2
MAHARAGCCAPVIHTSHARSALASSSSSAGGGSHRKGSASADTDSSGSSIVPTARAISIKEDCVQRLHVRSELRHRRLLMTGSGHSIDLARRHHQLRRGGEHSALRAVSEKPPYLC